MKRLLIASHIGYTWIITGTMLLILVSRGAFAQHAGDAQQQADPLESQFFFNRYLGNPAMAGLDTALHLNAIYRKQFDGLPGAPVTGAFTADVNTGKRVGLGLIAYNDNAGLIKRTRLNLTYTYHLPVGEYGQKLHFGISAAFAHIRLDRAGIIGDEPDPSVTKFNARKNAFESDFGMAYTDSHMTIQGSLTNLFSYFKNIDNTTGDVSTFYAAASYKFNFGGTVNSIEPQVSLQGVKQYNSILDIGVRLTMLHNLLSIYGMGHTSGTFSTGVGVNYKSILLIQGSYLSQTSGLRNYTNGSYEISLQIIPFRKGAN